MLAVLQHALESPLLHFLDIHIFRQQLAFGFQHYSTTYNALYLGAQAATPGMAFLGGYQNAIRCLDHKCPNDELAAFCVSEKGVRKPWDMQTRVVLSDDDYVLEGQKGYVMLLPGELDRMYVIAKNNDNQLRCLYVQTDADGISTTDVLAAPFVEDIPHSGVRFDDVKIPAMQVFGIDGHQQANKPFRYWEDMHVALSMMGWMSRALLEKGESFDELVDMIELICQLIEQYEEYPDYYSLKGILLLDQSHEVMDRYAKYLSENSKSLWLKDRLLLQMGQKIRHMVKSKIAN